MGTSDTTIISSLSHTPYEAGSILLVLVSVHKVLFYIGECIYRVSFWGDKKYKPYFISS